MTPKDYLKQIQQKDRRLQLEREKLDRLRAAVEYRSPDFGGSAHTGTDKSAALDKLIEHTARYDRMAADYIDFYNTVEQQIKALGGVLSEVLERRYLLYEKWEDIAAAMNYTERRIYQLHGVALQKISLNFTIEK